MSVPYRVLLLNQIDPHGIEVLEERGEKEERGIAIFDNPQACDDPDVILLRSAYMAGVPDCVKVIARAGVGINNIPVDDCSQKGIPVINTPGANANAVRELVLAAMLMVSRQLRGALQRVDELMEEGNCSAEVLEEVKRDYRGTELRGRSLGVVGLGAIGQRVAESALSMGMQVIGFDPALSDEQRSVLSSEVPLLGTLADVFGRSDFISLHIPLLPSTQGLVNDELLRYCNRTRGSCLLNFSRAPIVVPEAVRAALDNGQLAAYATDFFAEGLTGRDDVLCFPHLGASTVEAERNCAVMAAERAVDFLYTGSIEHAVNFPVCEFKWNTPYRLSVSNLNESGALNAVTSVLEDNNLNIIHMYNGSSGKMAYTLIDFNEEPPDALIEHLESLDKIVRVRSLRRPIA